MFAQRLLQPRYCFRIARLFMQNPCNIVAGRGPTNGKRQVRQRIVNPIGTNHGNSDLITRILIGGGEVADDFTGFQTFLPVLFRRVEPHQLQLHLDILRMHSSSILQYRQCLLTATSRLLNTGNPQLRLNTVRIGNGKFAVRLHRLCILFRILLVHGPCQQVLFGIPAEHPLSFPKLRAQLSR